MMKRLQLVLLYVLCLAGTTVAQTSQNPGEVFIRQASFEHNDAVKQFTGDFTTLFNMEFDAFGGFDEDTNAAFVNIVGDDNSSDISQNGWGNMALVNIMGDRNTSGLSQKGNNNQFILNLEGDDNSVVGEQVGSENRLRMDLVGTVKNQTFSQTGNNLTLQLIDNGSANGVPMQIEQRGNGASVIIENH